MGVWDEYCLICGAPNYSDVKKYNWMDKHYFITNDNKILKTSSSDYTGSYYNINNKHYELISLTWHDKLNQYGYGIMCHQNCYKLLNDKLKYTLKFGDVCRILSKTNNLLKSKSKYGKISKYQDQFFNWNKVVENIEYVLIDPLKNKENAKRIIELWQPLINSFNNKPIRKSPCESATNFKVGFKMIGNNGNMWIVKNMNGIKKWISL